MKIQYNYEIMILGLTPAGLFLLRELSKNKKKVLAVGLKGNIGLHSKYGHKITIEKLEDIEAVFLKYFNPEMKIHICSDPFINYLVDEEHKIFQSNKCFPDYKSAKILSDKILTGKISAKNNIEYPNIYSLEDKKLNNIENYPLILKWNRRKTFTEPFKTILIKTKKELYEAKKKNKKYLKDLIVQEYIPKNNIIDISYGGYYLYGEEKMQITVLQKRQYPEGITCFAEEYKGEYVEIIKRNARKLISEFDYCGFVEVEFKVDTIRKKIYLIEVNPRTWGWIKILKRKYKRIDLESFEKNKNINNRMICSVNILRDLRAIINMIRNKDDEIKSVLKDYQKKPIMDILEIHDLDPFLFQFKNSFYNIKKRKNNTI